MLIRAVPAQIAEMWASIKQGVMGALPTDTSEAAVLQALIDDKLQMWLVVRAVDNKVTLLGILTTQIKEEGVSGEKALLIYTLYGVQQMTLADFEANMQGLRNYAREQGCQRIVAYTIIDNVIKLAERLGADVSTRFLIFKVE